ncbi:MAG: 3-methylitaconate isomerase, partial [Candidatus Atribacteria bacterium]|nr:3-methylitaconate isomerase [Candidatus Atribacteria bacterium]
MRGGTSKGLYMLEKDLPIPGRERDDLLLRLMGSPDARQIDGLGGGASTTSKVAILATSSEQGIDIDYTFAQVSVDKPIVSYAGNCGNISAGVGPFAIECGLVKTNTPTTTVRIFNT